MEKRLSSLPSEDLLSYNNTVLSGEIDASSRIESVYLDRNCILRQLEKGKVRDSYIASLCTLYSEALERGSVDEERLFRWHTLLIPKKGCDYGKLTVGAWRKSPVYVVSQFWGRYVIHFEGPPAERVPSEMEAFFKALNGELWESPILRSALLHLWFVTIHPFSDGNGRTSRLVALMQFDCLLPLSFRILKHQKAYYDTLKCTQSSSLDVTEYLKWFISIVGEAFRLLSVLSYRR